MMLASHKATIKSCAVVNPEDESMRAYYSDYQAYLNRHKDDREVMSFNEYLKYRGAK